MSQLAQPISEFLDRHPAIRIEVDLNDRRQDLIEANIALAIRVGELEDSTLIAANSLTCILPCAPVLNICAFMVNRDILPKWLHTKCWSIAMSRLGANGFINAIASR